MTKRTTNGEALTRLLLDIFRVNGELLSAGNKITKPFGLTSARWQIMGAIDQEGRPLTVSQVARRMGSARQGVQRIANELEGLGLISAAPNIDHKRAPLFNLSEDGKKVIAKINDAQAEWVNEIARDLPAGQIAMASELLTTILERSEKSQKKLVEKGN